MTPKGQQGEVRPEDKDGPASKGAGEMVTQSVKWGQLPGARREAEEIPKVGGLSH